MLTECQNKKKLKLIESLKKVMKLLCNNEIRHKKVCICFVDIKKADYEQKDYYKTMKTEYEIIYL